jgi:sodium transport system permease protein
MSPAVIVFLKECRESLRDRRVLINSLLVGPLIGPLLVLVLMRLAIGREVEKAERSLPVVIVGAERAPELIDALRQMGMNPLPPVADPELAVREQRIDLALRITAEYAAAWRSGHPAQVELIYDSSRREAQGDVERLRGMLDSYSRRNGALRLLARGVAPAIATPLVMANRDAATPEARGALLFAMLPYMLVLTMFVGGIGLAIDSTAGERERLSLEPLLINPVPRDRILLGKLLATALFSLASLTLGLLAFLLVGRFVPTDQMGLSLALGPHFFAVALPMLLPLVLLIGITQILLAGFARSVREAQTYLGLAQLVPLIPSIVLSLLPVKAQLWMYAVPLLGQQLAIMRLLRAEPLPGFALWLTALMTLLAVLAVFLLARRVYNSERLAITA